MAADDGRVLLSPDVEPVRYSIELDVDLDRYSYKGEEAIEIQVLNACSSITVHSKELYIKSATCRLHNGETDTAKSITFDLKLTTVTFSFDKTIPAGLHVLEIAFEGCLNDKMAGFYRSHYTAVSGEKRIMASTQFEALDARRCFPCWDEPARKAVFEVTLTVPNDRAAFSNMPEAESHELPNNRRKIKFLPSPLMSTYLLAFCVGEFDYVQAVTEHGVLCRVYTPPGKSHTGTFALKVALKTLDLYDDFFQIPYPLPKLDMVAIPEFAMGAMENWGLVTYREVDLLIDETASADQRQRVCTVVTHELAHQWFGNLVTMGWWCDLWLNEGFASWTETYAADLNFPEWKMWEQFSVNDFNYALRLDSLRTSHPIQVPIKHAEEVEEVFDGISYCKGACVVKMLYAVLGPDDFQKGLQLYMKKYQYKNTETVDLWSAWEEVSGKPIRAIMATWTEQMGHPVVSVTSEEWTPTSVKLSLKQSWFLADGSQADDRTWKIPLQIATAATAGSGSGGSGGGGSGGGGSGGGGSGAKLEFMEGVTKEVTLALQEEGEWVSLNYGQHTLMRVQYTPEMLKRLVVAVRSKALPPQDGAGLLGDAFALAKAGSLPVEEVLRLLPAYIAEDSSTVWEMLEIVLLGLDKVLTEDDATHGHFVAFASTLVAPLAERIGWQVRPTDDHSTKMLRGAVIRLLKTFSSKSPEVVAEARKRFDALCADIKNRDALPADFTVPVFQLVLKNGGEAEYEKLMELFERFETNAEKTMVYKALGYAESPALKRRALQWALEEVKLQDQSYVLGSVSASGKAGLELSWQFLQENFDQFKARLAGASPSLTDAVIVTCSGGFADERRINEVEAFYKAHPLPSNQRKISQTLEGMRIQSRFLKSIAASQLSTEAFWKELGELCSAN